MLQTLGWLTQTIELKSHILQTYGLPQSAGKQNQLSVYLGAAKTQCFSANLVKLPVAAALRAFMAEHRPHVIQALTAFVQQVVLDDRAHHTGGGLGAQRQLLSVQTVFKGIHFLFNNVGHFTKAAHKQSRRFNNRRAYIAVGVQAHDIAHSGFQGLPASRLGRQNVVHAFDGG